MTALTLAFALLATPAPQEREPDRDRDGLSDFQEIHKYGTDPERADSDGDGVPDGDWLERREYAYTVRRVVHVMRPVTLEWLDDDYQDVRVLDQTDEHVELEVIHYPFSTAGEAIEGDPDWKRSTRRRDLREWLAPGPTADWDEEVRRELLAALRADGIDPDALDDATLVRRASAWLLARAEYEDGFTCFSAAFDADGRPFVPEPLRGVVEAEAQRMGRSLEEQWERELSARGMFRHRVRGACSSSAIYLSGALRALGIPARTILCIPIADWSDERERRLVEQGIAHPEVRRTILRGMQGLERSWASHTFNEVFVGGRWRRLDYDELGAGILRAGRFGLMTHVATFRDWADARMPETIGRRQGLGLKDVLFDGTNPYSTIALRDEIGPHCGLELPPVEALVARIAGVRWTDDEGLPENVRAGIERHERFGLLAELTELGGADELRDLLAAADLRVYLEAEGHPRLGVGLDPGCWWYMGDHALVYLPFGPSDRSNLRAGVDYRVRPRNDAPDARLEADAGLVIRR